jgi:hypothetical protein
MTAHLQIELLFDGVDIFALLSQEQQKLTAGASLVANSHNSMHS